MQISVSTHYPSAGKPVPRKWEEVLKKSIEIPEPSSAVIWEHEGGFRVLIAVGLLLSDVHAYMWREDEPPIYTGVIDDYRYEAQFI